MIPQNLIPLLSSALLFVSNASAQQVFDGYFNPGSIAVTPVWMELQLPAADGPVTGSYWYKKKGLPLQLGGTLRGDQIQLSEWEKKGKITGTFTLTRKNDSLSGGWQRPKENPMNPDLPIRMAFYPASPEDKTFAVFPKPKDLRLLNGKTFAQELKEQADEDEGGKKALPDIRFQSYRKNIVSLSIGGEYSGGAYPNSWSKHFNFDLETRREFDVDSEIDPGKSAAFQKLVNSKLQEQLAKERKSMPDEDWEDAFGDKLPEPREDSPEPLSICFNIETHSDCGTGDGPNYYTFTENALHVSMDHFFGFPHATQSMDLYLEAEVPLKEVRKYLRKDSRLNRLVQDAR